MTKIQVEVPQPDRIRTTAPTPGAKPDEYGFYHVPQRPVVLTYETERSLGVGDSVRVPRPYYMGTGAPLPGTVVALSSDYDGPCVRI